MSNSNKAVTARGRTVKKEKQYAEIAVNPDAVGSFPKEKFHVRYVAENGKVLSFSEGLPSRSACHTNIIAMVKLAHGTYMQVHDRTTKKETAYRLYVGGTIQPLSK